MVRPMILRASFGVRAHYKGNGSASDLDGLARMVVKKAEEAVTRAREP
jgi:hypothetical protein